MALTTDQLRNLSRLYDRWQSGDIAAREAVQREVDASGADVARGFALMFASADADANTAATLLPPIPKAMRDAAVLAVGESDSGVANVGRTSRPSIAPFNDTLSGTGNLPTREPGQRVGPYRLIKELGRGGMGVVWLAERADGQHSRQVALKMPLVENLNWLLAARFARERNILASLEHPSIARLYDAGVDQADRNAQPYIAIEYVQGVPITDYVKEKRLKPEATALLFIRVIEAVAHAHTQLVIHRDIKPSNILVDAKGEPHLLDFGIAKLLDDEDTLSADATQLTKLSGRALTLDYASPEQVNNAPLGVASDVYALGVVLYELLTGSRPYHPRGPTRRDLELAILEQEPSKPSDHLLGTGDSESGKSARRMRGDLDTIVLKALRKDAKLRYGSAQAFADDLKRYLSYEPIQARPDGVVYRITKFIRRQRVPLVIAVVSCTVIAGLSWRAWQQQQVAQISTARAQSVDGLLKSIFDGMSPDVADSQIVTAKQLLSRAQTFLASDTALEPRTRRGSSMRVADLMREIGAYADAAAIYDQQRIVAKQAKDVAGEGTALWKATDALIMMRSFDDAQARIDHLQTLLDASVPGPDELYAYLRHAQGHLALYMDRASEAAEHYRGAEAELTAARISNTTLNAWVVQGQAYAARALGNLALARERLVAARLLFQRATGPTSREFLETTVQLSQLESEAGRFTESLALADDVAPVIFSRLGHEHPLALNVLRNQAFALMRTGQFAAAKVALDGLRSVAEPLRAQEDSYANLLAALMLMYSGDFVTAESTLGSVLSRVPVGTAGTARINRSMGELLMRAGRATEAHAMLIATEKLQSQLFGERHPDVALTRVLLACSAARQNDLRTARAKIQDAVTVLTAHRGDEHPVTLVANSYAALLLHDDRETARDVRRALANRIVSEIGWQPGASDLAIWLRASIPNQSWRELPVVF